jgi:hypothetical protein
VLRNPVAVEKLAQSEFAKIGSRQEALQMIFLSLLDIFYHPIFDFFRKTDFFNSHSCDHQLSQFEIGGDNSLFSTPILNSTSGNGVN